jgi:hypothetical protein
VTVLSLTKIMWPPLAERTGCGHVAIQQEVAGLYVFME